MVAIPIGMVEVGAQGLVKIRTASGPMPVFMLMDEQQRSIAIPLTQLELELLQHTLEGERQAPPQPYRTMLDVLAKLEVKLEAVYIRYDEAFTLPTALLLRPGKGESFEVATTAADSIVYAHLAGTAILIDEELMSAISSRPVGPLPEQAQPQTES